MILWINGAFGAGKSQTAYELKRRIPDSFVLDPEQAGYYIRKNLPDEVKKSDFQDYLMWREFNYAMLRYLDANSTRIIIAPMTITNPAYFDEIIGRLRKDGVDVRHFTLFASREVLLKRLKSRGDGEKSWPAQQIDRCVKELSQDVFKHRIDTDQMSIDEVVEKIAEMAEVSLLPDHRGKIRKKMGSAQDPTWTNSFILIILHSR
ncbi:AAA family ATPase [Paenibacillus sp. DMB20]|uniref:AAA family ATPase n=1 Tax=Paenibacillus sp. DMB20 TaxID=1642570 RepID=UPI000AFD6205